MKNFVIERKIYTRAYMKCKILPKIISLECDKYDIFNSHILIFLIKAH